MGAGCHSIVIEAIVVVFIIAGQLQLFVGPLSVQCWPLFAAHHLLCVWLSSCWVIVMVLGGWGCLWWWGCMTWHVDNVEGALVVIDAGDVDMWLLSVVVECGC